MWRHNFLSYSGKIIVSLILEIIYFPVWWYSAGLFRLLKNVWRFFKNRESSLGFLIWLKHIFVPMYGQYDFMGRLISFFIRLVQIIVRGIVLLFWGILCLFVIILWALIPILLFLTLIYQILQ